MANYPNNPSSFKLYTGYNGWQWTSSKRFSGCYGTFDVSQMYSAKTHQNSPKKAIYYRYNPKMVYGRTPINRYKDIEFKHKIDSFPAGTVFAIAKVIDYGRITRFQLANGYSITSNQANINC